MTNELINLDTMSHDQIMKALGQVPGGSSGNNIPRLGINRSPEDDDGNRLPIGNFFVYVADAGESIYGKPITFRPFVSAMQYMHYEPEKGEYVNRSIIFKNWKDEAIDIQGGVRCGKIPFKQRNSLTPEELAEQKKIRCYRLVYGLVSMNGARANGEQYKVENCRSLWRVTGTSFSPMGSALEQIDKKKKLLFSCVFTVNSKKQKKGGNTFYIPDIKLNLEANMSINDEDRETLNSFQQIIHDENEEVVNLWKESRAKASGPKDVIDAKVVDELDNPEKMLSTS